MNFLKGHIKVALFLTLFIFLIAMTGQQMARAAEARTLHVKPFTVQAQKDISFLQDAMRNMMASRLAANAKLQVIEEADKADYLLEGVITAIGETLSINAKIITRDGSQPPATYYASAASENDIIGAVDKLAANISQQSFGKKVSSLHIAEPLAPSVPVVGQPVAPPAPAFENAHPDRAFIRPAVPGAQAPNGSAFLSGSIIANNSLGFSKTQNMKLAIQDISVADLDGDGVDDIVVAGSNEIVVFHLRGSRLIRFGAITLPSNQKIISAVAADLNGNGIAEIYVSAVAGSRPAALAVEWRSDSFNYLFEKQRWYIKPMSVPGRGLLLAGQEASLDAPFSPGIFELSVVDGGLVKGEALPVPGAINVFSFALADLDGDGSTEVITINEYDRLSVLRAGGQRLWQSDDFFGGSLRYVGGNGAQDRRGARKMDKTYIPSRIILADINNDNLPDVVVNKNPSTASRLFKKMKSYPSGEIYGFVWSGIGLSELWHTKKIDGYVAAYDFRRPGGADQATLYVGLIGTSGWLDMLNVTDSVVLIYPVALGSTASN